MNPDEPVALAPQPVAPPRAILFDFDGVVADTANLHVAAWGRTFGDLGWAIEPKRLESATWLDDLTWIQTVFQDLGLLRSSQTPMEAEPAMETTNAPRIPFDQWVASKRRMTRRIVETSPPDRWLSAGVPALIHHLRGREGLRLGLVTSAMREDVEAILAPSGLLGAFAQVITRDDPTPTKPDPGPYLLALERLRVSADQAVALEDSPAGLVSAHAAGLKVVAVGSLIVKSERNGNVTPSHRLADLRDLPSVLSTLGLG